MSSWVEYSKLYATPGSVCYKIFKQGIAVDQISSHFPYRFEVKMDPAKFSKSVLQFLLVLEPMTGLTGTEKWGPNI